MSAIDEGIVREYFEQSGFLVRQVRKYQVQSRKKQSDEEIDLLVYNPAWKRQARKPDFFLFASELPYLHRAVVAVKPWHTGVFSAAMIKGSPEILRFLEEQVIKEIDRFFPPTDDAEAGDAPAKILVLPGLPTQEPYRSQAVALLQERGVDGIISFRAMLLDLIDKIEVNRNYRKSDTMQVIRILKNYELLRDSQLDLLGGDRRAKL
ncbi:hypothetical protein [Synoicihabitans lomoniglobus]|uniref:Uncharacterized protein n=1 Tax=Synoicihabitans lomoniglobus TaxID=2909285 RepID=A0AAF0CPS3_9BACT|nr:hypothetical protein [Opitutaceae bacterium LMO-M01]WED65816.1 hypothetical protein PXH66_03010 [Opitutaceae bacterium LMO-M01]